MYQLEARVSNLPASVLQVSMVVADKAGVPAVAAAAHLPGVPHVTHAS